MNTEGENAKTASVDSDSDSRALVRKTRNGAMWLYWMVGISVVNSLLLNVGIPLRFSFGLILTDLIYKMGLSFGPLFADIGMFADILILGALLIFGYFASKQRVWAFIGGLAIVALDTLFIVWLHGLAILLSICIHLMALFSLWRGARVALAALKSDGTSPDDAKYIIRP